MERVALGIGGMGVTLAGGDTLHRAMALPGMRVFAVRRHLDGIEIVLDAETAVPECRWLQCEKLESKSGEFRLGIDREGVYYCTFGDGVALRYDMRQPDRVVCSSVEDETLLLYVLWIAYALAGLHRGRVPVHSSTVVCDGRAVLCLGESGTGKSTHTRLWIENIAGSYLLNDDSPILAVEHGEVAVYGSPWSGKSPCFRQERRPVAALLRLEQRKENTICPLRVLEAFAALQPSCPPLLAHDERLTDMMVDFISNVIERTAVFRMGCLPDAAAARLSHDTIFAGQ